MLIDGESGGPYHKWQLTTPVLKKELEETELFQVDLVTLPAKPEFSKLGMCLTPVGTIGSIWEWKIIHGT